MAISSGVYSKPRQCEASITNFAKKLLQLQAISSLAVHLCELFPYLYMFCS